MKNHEFVEIRYKFKEINSIDTSNNILLPFFFFWFFFPHTKSIQNTKRICFDNQQKIIITLANSMMTDGMQMSKHRTVQSNTMISQSTNMEIPKLEFVKQTATHQRTNTPKNLSSQDNTHPQDILFA